MAPEPLPAVSLDNYVKPELVSIHSSVENKDALFKNFADQFGRHRPGINTHDVFLGLQRREAAQNTGVCHGVAMPHATLTNLDRTYLMVQHLETPLDYDAPDNEPVDLVFATLGPPSDRQLHLVLLAQISKLILETSILDKIRGAQNDNEIVEILKEALKNGG